VMGDPGLLQKIPDIPPLLPQGGGDGEQTAAAECAMAGCTPRLLLGRPVILRSITAGLRARSAALLVGSIPGCSRKV
jgi:hypothetical protein